MPKLKTIQIVWHGKEPVYSLDFHANGLLFTAGADKEIKIWKVSRDKEEYPVVEHAGSLVGHSKTVNCVRVSPDGKCIASGSDGGELLLWTRQDTPIEGNLISEEEARAEWRRKTVLRGHTDDVMDLAWSTDGTALLSGSIDNKGMIWDISEKKIGTIVAHLANHKHFVQGVAWDPHQQFVMTQSADRTCKVYALRPSAASKKKSQKKGQSLACVASKEFYCHTTMSKRIVGSSVEDSHPQRHALFYDESMPSFFRRPSWSPDGSFVIIPAGIYKEDTNMPEQNTAYLYARGKWASPVAHVPGQPKPIVSVRFCPVIFEKEKEDNEIPKPFEILPYKLVYAIATTDSVVLYDTSSSKPLAAFFQIHFDSITDIAWSKDGQFLAISSRDCFCSVAAFGSEELGKKIALEKLPKHILEVLPSARIGKDDKVLEIERETLGKENCSSVEIPEKSQGVEVSVKRKRITATPISVGRPVSNGAAALSNSTAMETTPRPCSTSHHAVASKQKRRITPVAIETLNRDELTTAQTESMTVGNIAALAAAAGQDQAAKSH